MEFLVFFIASLWMTVVAVFEPARKPVPCPGVDYSPCNCTTVLLDEKLGQSVFAFVTETLGKPNIPEFSVVCNRVSIAEIKNLFSQMTARDIKSIQLNIKRSETAPIPADFLGTSRTSELRIHCLGTLYKLRIDENAFNSSRNYTEKLNIEGCNFKKQPNFSFLNGFQNLSQLIIDKAKNFNSFQGLPSKLNSLTIEHSRGFENLTNDTNIMLPNLKKLVISDNQIGDVAAAKILEIFTSSSNRSLTFLDMRANSLTRIPEIIPTFTKLEQLWLEYNVITSIDIKPFAFSDSTSNIHLSNNAISSIKPNVFGVGDYHYVDLDQNKLTRLDSYVFQRLLEIIFRGEESGRGSLWINQNPIECDCHLAWLIVHKRHLLPLITGGICSNSTSLEGLNPEGFRDCPVFTCPDNLDGNFLNPLTCSSYYTCTSGKSTLVNCPGGQVFSPSKQTCDSVNNVPTCNSK